jgi:hypothetical protein
MGRRAIKQRPTTSITIIAALCSLTWNGFAEERSAASAVYIRIADGRITAIDANGKRVVDEAAARRSFLSITCALKTRPPRPASEFTVVPQDVLSRVRKRPATSAFGRMSERARFRGRANSSLPANGRLSSFTAFRADRTNRGFVPCVEARIGGRTQAANFSGVRYGRAQRQQVKARRGVGPLYFSRSPKVQRSSSPPQETARSYIAALGGNSSSCA